MGALSTLVRVATRAVVAICGITLLGAAWRQAEVVLMVAGPFAGAVPVVSAGLRGATQTAVVLRASAMGSGATAIPNRLRRGDPGDVVIVAEAAYEAWPRRRTSIQGVEHHLARWNFSLGISNRHVRSIRGTGGGPLNQ